MYTTLLFSLLVVNSSRSETVTPVLMYHAVDDHIDGSEELFVSPAEFYKQMKYLHEQKYTTLTFNDIDDYHKYKNPILITFDDGYKDLYQYAFPILKEFNFKATVFLITGYVDHPGYLSQKEISEMSGVFSFESHTVSHPQLDQMTDAQVEKECKESKAMIEKITHKPVNALSYPYGRYNKNVLAIAEKYYKYCVTTNYGNYKTGDKRYEIKRINVARSDTIDTYREIIRKGRIR